MPCKNRTETDKLDLLRRFRKKKKNPSAVRREQIYRHGGASPPRKRLSKMSLLVLLPPTSPHMQLLGESKDKNNIKCTTGEMYWRRYPIGELQKGGNTKGMHKYLTSRVQILSCKSSYKIKAWCSFCLQLDQRFRVALFTSGCRCGLQTQREMC